MKVTSNSGISKTIPSVIRQKGESQNGYFKKTKHANFSEKEHFLPPDTQTYMCVSWKTRFEIRPSALLPRIHHTVCHLLFGKRRLQSYKVFH